jgi:hypothetical protein
MKNFSVVLAALAAIAFAMPSVASAKPVHHHHHHHYHHHH